MHPKQAFPVSPLRLSAGALCSHFSLLWELLSELLGCRNSILGWGWGWGLCCGQQSTQAQSYAHAACYRLCSLNATPAGCTRATSQTYYLLHGFTIRNLITQHHDWFEFWPPHTDRHFHSSRCLCQHLKTSHWLLTSYTRCTLTLYPHILLPVDLHS